MAIPELPPGTCGVCQTEVIGCCCDGAYDPHGCFKCNPGENLRPLCDDGCPNRDRKLVEAVMAR